MSDLRITMPNLRITMPNPPPQQPSFNNSALVPENPDFFSAQKDFGIFVGCDGTGCYTFNSERLFNAAAARFATETAPSLDPTLAGIPIVDWICEEFLISIFQGTVKKCMPVYDNNVWKGVMSDNLQRTHAFGWYAGQFPDQVQLIDPDELESKK